MKNVIINVIIKFQRDKNIESSNFVLKIIRVTKFLCFFVKIFEARRAFWNVHSFDLNLSSREYENRLYLEFVLQDFTTSRSSIEETVTKKRERERKVFSTNGKAIFLWREKYMFSKLAEFY